MGSRLANLCGINMYYKYGKYNSSIDCLPLSTLNNQVFIDMTDTFAAAYQADYTLAHGFANTGVGIGHLNRDGHRMIAEALAAEIGEEQK